MYSAILPRPDQSNEINQTVKDINTAKEKMCKARKFPFLHIFRPFIDKEGQYHRYMFAARDNGFHLNLEGSRVSLEFLFASVEKSTIGVDRTLFLTVSSAFDFILFIYRRCFIYLQMLTCKKKKKKEKKKKKKTLCLL